MKIFFHCDQPPPTKNGNGDFLLVLRLSYHHIFNHLSRQPQGTEDNLMFLGGGAGKLIRKTRLRTIIQEGFGRELRENSGIQKRETWCLG